MSMDDRDGVIWSDGKLLPWRDAKVHLLTHTLHYGMGVFEGIRAYNTARGTAIFKLEAHTRRFLNSARILGMPLDYDYQALFDATVEVVRKNGLESGYIRPMAYFGSESMGLHAADLKSHIMIAAWPWGSYLGEEKLASGLRAKISSFTRHHVNISMCQAKANGHYLNSLLAVNEAVQCGYDEAILLDSQGFVAEGSGENIFLVHDNTLYTPETTAALNGITRNTIIDLARDHGYEVKIKRITRDELYIADEVFFTGTAAEVTPIREIDNRVIGTGSRGPVTEKLQSAYFDIVQGRNPDYTHWLTYLD
ncbi:MAG: branched-chain amino acid transaminase [Gammaproteobacteria bacterium]|nr:MAG: branched-chain amino acid transaminase [Gammaproteobacteria bacterium]